MDLESRMVDNVNVLALSGSFNNYTAQAVRQWIDTATTTAPAWLVVNLSQVGFMDSTALSTLVHGMKRSRELNGDLRLCGLQQPVRMIFEMTRLDQIFEIFTHEADAVLAYQARAQEEASAQDEVANDAG
jgi:anti-sigma B factor antagonist